MRCAVCKSEGLPHERSSAADGVAIIPRCVVVPEGVRNNDDVEELAGHASILAKQASGGHWW